MPKYLIHTQGQFTHFIYVVKAADEAAALAKIKPTFCQGETEHEVQIEELATCKSGEIIFSFEK